MSKKNKKQKPTNMYHFIKCWNLLIGSCELLLSKITIIQISKLNNLFKIDTFRHLYLNITISGLNKE